MALSGSYSKTYTWPRKTSESVTQTIEWRVLSQDAVNNTSTLQLDCYLVSTCAVYSSINQTSSLSIDSSVSLNGSSIQSVIDGYISPIPANTKYPIYSGTTTIQHESSNDQSFTFSFSFRFDSSFTTSNGDYLKNSSDKMGSSTGWLATGTQTYIIDHIVRSATLDSILDGLTTCTDEDPLNILYTNPMGNDAVSLQAAISVSNGAAMEVPYRNISKTGTVYTFNLTTSEWAAIYAKTLDKKVTSCPIRFYIKSIVPVLDGNTTETVVQYREGTMSFINYAPVFDPEPVFVDINPVTTTLTGNPEIFVRHASNVQFQLNAKARKQATLTDYFASNAGSPVHALTGVLNGVTGEEFIALATDNRGFTVGYTETHTVGKGDWVEYVPLTCVVKNGLLDTQGKLTVTIGGKYFGGSFGAQDNSLYVKYSIRESGDATSWISVYVSKDDLEIDSDNNYTYSFTIENLDYTERYVLSVRATDKINSEGAVSETIIGAVPVFDWGKDDFAFYVPVTINGATVDSVIEEKSVSGYYMNSSGQHSSGGFTWKYRKWTSGLIECWCTLPLTTTVNTAWGNMYVASTQYKTDLSYPVQLTETPHIIVTLGAGATKGLLIADNSYAADNIATGRYNIASPVAITTSTTFRLNYYVRGKWK